MLYETVEHTRESLFQLCNGDFPMYVERLLLALHAPGGIAAQKVMHLGERHQIQVTRNRVLEGRGRYRKVQGRFLIPVAKP